MKVPLLDLKIQYKQLEQEIDEKLKTIFLEQRGVLGSEVTELEEAIAKHCESRFAVGVASGTDAILLSLMALDIQPSDGVITTPFTFFATVGSIVRLGAKPFFCDIDPKTFNLDPDKVRHFLETECMKESDGAFHSKSGTKIKVLLPVHLYGQCADMDQLMAIAKEWNMYVVEDACQAIGAKWSGKQAGDFGDFGTLSFFPSKNLGGLGDGGMVLTQGENKEKLVRMLRVHGSEVKYYHKVVGINSRLDTVQAAILLVKLDYLESWTKMRQENAATYDKAFKELDKVQTPYKSPMASHVYNQYCLRAKNRDVLRAYLTKKNIGSDIYYPVPLHLQECFRYLGYRDGDFPVTEKACEEVLALPIYSELSREQMGHVIQVIKDFYEKGG